MTAALAFAAPHPAVFIGLWVVLCAAALVLCFAAALGDAIGQAAGLDEGEPGEGEAEDPAGDERRVAELVRPYTGMVRRVDRRGRNCPQFGVRRDA